MPSGGKRPGAGRPSEASKIDKIIQAEKNMPRPAEHVMDDITLTFQHLILKARVGGISSAEANLLRSLLPIVVDANKKSDDTAGFSFDFNESKIASE